MALKDSKGARLEITSPVDANGTAITIDDHPAWAAGTVYREGAQVSVGSGGDTIYARCITQHSSVAGGLTESSGALGGTQTSNWVQVEEGNVARLASATYTVGGETATIDQLNLTTATTIATTRADTMEVVVWEDPEDLFQGAFQFGATMTVTLYPQGKPASGQKRSKFVASVVVTGYTGGTNFAEPTQETVSFGVQGDGITKSTETGS